MFAAPNEELTFEKIALMFGAMLCGKIAATATAIVAAIKAYSIKSCPPSSHHSAEAQSAARRVTCVHAVVSLSPMYLFSFCGVLSYIYLAPCDILTQLGNDRSTLLDIP